MKWNFKSLGWYLIVDFLIIIAVRIFAPDYYDSNHILSLFISSIVLWFIFERKKK